jgi:hypothetical protein
MMRKKARRKGGRPTDVLRCRVVIFLFSFFVEADGLTAIEFRAEPGTHPNEALWSNGLTSAGSGLQLDLVIA